MIKTIQHSINLLKNSFRDVGVSEKRSDKWPKVEKDFLSSHPTCEACGGKENLNVHHCMPFHIDKALELDEKNLITLCMGEKECHLHIGHSGSFKKYNPNVRKDAAEALAHPKEFDAIVKRAAANFKVN
jgi:hypothetical protein